MSKLILKASIVWGDLIRPGSPDRVEVIISGDSKNLTKMVEQLKAASKPFQH